MFDVRESDPLELSEKATLPVMYGIISQETCRVFMVKHNFGEKSAADLSAYDLCCRCTLCPTVQDFSLVNLLHSPCFSAGRDFFVFGGFLCLATTKKNGQ